MGVWKNEDSRQEMTDYFQIETIIKAEESYRADIYLDHKGNLTGGWGSLLNVGMTLPKQVWEILFRKRFDDAVNGCDFAMELNGVELSDARCAVIIDMVYCHGRRGILGYKNMWKAIRKDDFERASAEILDSSWHRDLEIQRGGRKIETRSMRAARRMKSGEI